MNILILIAGTNHPSNSAMLAGSFADGIEAFSPTAQVHTVRLDTLHIDHFNLSHYDSATDQGKDFLMIEKMIKEADGVVIASPVWNFSVPGHLKNLIDRMGTFALDETRSIGQLKGKPFYLIFTGGMPETGWILQKRTTSHIPVSLQYFGGTVIGTHYEGRCTAGRGVFREVVSGRPQVMKTVKEKGKKFAEVVEIFATEGTLPATQTAMKWFWERVGQGKKMMGM